jgi:hypothetical protein
MSSSGGQGGDGGRRRLRDRLFNREGSSSGGRRFNILGRRRRPAAVPLIPVQQVDPERPVSDPAPAYSRPPTYATEDRIPSYTTNDPQQQAGSNGRQSLASVPEGAPTPSQNGAGPSTAPPPGRTPGLGTVAENSFLRDSDSSGGPPQPSTFIRDSSSSGENNGQPSSSATGGGGGGGGGGTTPGRLAAAPALDPRQSGGSEDFLPLQHTEGYTQHADTLNTLEQGQRRQ